MRDEKGVPNGGSPTLEKGLHLIQQRQRPLPFYSLPFSSIRFHRSEIGQKSETRLAGGWPGVSRARRDILLLCVRTRRECVPLWDGRAHHLPQLSLGGGRVREARAAVGCLRVMASSSCVECLLNGPAGAVVARGADAPLGWEDHVAAVTTRLPQLSDVTRESTRVTSKSASSSPATAGSELETMAATRRTGGARQPSARGRRKRRSSDATPEALPNDWRRLCSEVEDRASTPHFLDRLSVHAARAMLPSMHWDAETAAALSALFLAPLWRAKRQCPVGLLGEDAPGALAVHAAFDAQCRAADALEQVLCEDSGATVATDVFALPSPLISPQSTVEARRRAYHHLSSLQRAQLAFLSARLSTGTFTMEFEKAVAAADRRQHRRGRGRRATGSDEARAEVTQLLAKCNARLAAVVQTLQRAAAIHSELRHSPTDT